MTYHKAIEEAKKVARITNINCIIFQWKKHWWQKYRYDCCPCGYMFAVICQANPVVKLLTITPNGTISQ